MSFAAPNPPPDSATRAGRMRTAANPLPANRAKIAPGRAANVRGDYPPPEPAGRILPPQTPPHLTDCRRPFPPPRAAADGRRMLRAGPARLRRRDRATCPAFFAPHCQRECAAAAVRNRRGMSHRARRRRWPPTAPPPSGGGEKCTGEWTARGWGRRTAQSGALDGRECGGRCWRRRGALGAGGGRMAD